MIYDFNGMTDEEVEELVARLASEAEALREALARLESGDDADVSAVDLSDANAVVAVLRQRTVDTEAVGRARMLLKANAAARDELNRERADRHSRRDYHAAYQDLLDRKKALLAAAAEIESHGALCKRLGKQTPLGTGMAGSIRGAIKQAEQFFGV